MPILLADPLRATFPKHIRADRLALGQGTAPEVAILESGPGFGEAGRWSIYGVAPRLVFEAMGPEWSLREVEGGRVVESGTGEALPSLARWMDRLGLNDAREPPGPDDPPFLGGLIGFFGYDLAPQLERLPRKARRDSRIPDVRFVLHDMAVVVDHRDAAIELVAQDFTGEGTSALAGRFRAVYERLCRMEAGPVPSSARLRSEPEMPRDAYLDAVCRVLEYIRAGDIFQVNFTQRFSARGRIEPLDLYLRLRALSPAPFAAFLKWGDLAVVSASPEWFYQTRGDHLVTRPIKGTRPRGKTPEEDARLVEELRASAKDRAELTMIVDLERNDLGRVCRFGTVKVIDPMAVETFAQVHHLVATVEGGVRSGSGPIDVVRAMFPGGSITGAPKIRAMEIIDELEPNRRSLYTGAIGYFGRGTSAFNIAIRTMLVEGHRVSYQVGGGIVADSDPAAEYEETLHKGRALRAVLEGEGLP